MKKHTFLDSFPGHIYRYLDTTGSKRWAIQADTLRKELNEKEGYDSYFTINGFSDYKNATYENCTNLNAFYVDIDGRKDPQELETIKSILEPSYIVETMRGYHIYWLLDEPIYKEDAPLQWEETQKRWLKQEAQIVKTLRGDAKAQDIPRILRVPDTLYWKGTGEAYKEGVSKALCTIKVIYENQGARYSMARIAEAFPVEETENQTPVSSEQQKKISEMHKRDFFAIVDKEYPMADRDMFQKLISGLPGTLIDSEGGRNNALLIASSLCKRAGWTEQETQMHFKTVGWHGIEKEHGGDKEIENTIASAFKRVYSYSMNHPVIAPLLSDKDRHMLLASEAVAIKKRKEKDAVRFSTYEKDILARHPHLKKNDASIFFDYQGGVYRMLTDEEINSMIFRAMEDDMLLGFRTRKHVSDKINALLSIIPKLEVTNDNGRILNVKNGLLDIVTRELKPHTPNFVSLSQSPVIYDKEATAPTWIQCVDAWTEGEDAEEKKIVLKQYAGYCLTSSMKYAKSLFLVGDGGNGKSTFADTIKMVVGKENTSNIDLEDISKDFGLAGLVGKRLNVVEEVSGNFYHSNILKKLVSGEEVTINMKYKSQFTFAPQVKFIFAVNQMPRVDDSSMASERRILAVHFKNNFRDNANVNLRYSTGALAKELSGVLNWALDGIVLLKEHGGFITTKEQKLILQEYRQENSSVEGFISECLIEAQGKVVSTIELYNEYIDFCRQDGRKNKSRVSFTKELRAHADRTKKFQFIARKSGKEVASFEGIEINKDWDTVTAFKSTF